MMIILIYLLAMQFHHNKSTDMIQLLYRADLIEGPLEVSFVSWPMVRYRREVIFGWVDLLGNIVSLNIDPLLLLKIITILQLLLAA